MRFFILICVFGIASTPFQTRAAEITVLMSNHEYQPTQVAASVGDTIRFVNNDGTDHNVFIPTAGFASDLGKQEPGQEKTLTVGKTGKFDVECVFHPGMLTTVEVK
jgi:plastocyanin